MLLSKRLLISVFFLALALCVGVIAVSLNPGLVTEAAAHIDFSDTLLMAVLLAVGAASVSHS